MCDKKALSEKLKEIVHKERNLDGKITKLSDEEMEFLEKNFVWDEAWLSCIKKNHQRPLDIYFEGFKNKCRICEVIMNYCSC